MANIITGYSGKWVKEEEETQSPRDKQVNVVNDTLDYYYYAHLHPRGCYWYRSFIALPHWPLLIAGAHLSAILYFIIAIDVLFYIHIYIFSLITLKDWCSSLGVFCNMALNITLWFPLWTEPIYIIIDARIILIDTCIMNDNYLHSDCQWWWEVQLIPSTWVGNWVGRSSALA